jgi:hypothetical protein
MTKTKSKIAPAKSSEQPERECNRYTRATCGSSLSQARPACRSRKSRSGDRNRWGLLMPLDDSHFLKGLLSLGVIAIPKLERI